MTEKNYLIGIAGNIGVGKTTLTKRMAAKLGWETYFESVIDNPYLSDFYNDMNRWSFNLQIYFLAHRFRTLDYISKSGRNSIQDRTIYEDVEIFARSIYEQGFMHERDYRTYRSLFYEMTKFIPAPDIIIYLKASPETLIRRIKSRGRQFEKTIDPNYIIYLNEAYARWMETAQNNFQIVTVETDHTDYVNKEKDLDELIEIVKRYCP